MNELQAKINLLSNEIYTDLEEAYSKAETIAEKNLWVDRMEACEAKVDELQRELDKAA